MDENVLCELVCLARSRARISNMLYYLVFHSAATEIEKFLPFAVNDTMLCTDHIFVKYTLFFAHTHTHNAESHIHAQKHYITYFIFLFSIFFIPSYIRSLSHSHSFLAIYAGDSLFSLSFWCLLCVHIMF